MAPRITTLANKFTAGEIDPELLGSVDLPEVQLGCSTLKNELPLRKGGLRRIPGTYDAGAGYSSGTVKCREVPFNAKSGNYVVEISSTKIRIWNSSHTVVQYSSADLVLTHTLTGAEIMECQTKVVDNELFIVHRNHKPQRIKETSPQPFTLDEPTFTGARTFSTATNYPGCVTAYRGSLVLGSTITEPSTYFLSRAPVASTGLFRTTDFTLGSNPDDAIIGFNTDGVGSRMEWIQASRRVAAGMTGTVWAEAGQALPSATSFYMVSIGYQGAAPLQATILGNALFYIGSPIPTLQMIVYSNEGGGMIDIEVSEHFRHLLEPGIVDLTAMTSPTPSLWLTRADGKIVAVAINGTAAGACLYETADGGLVQSATTMRGASGDELFMCILRGSVYRTEWLRFPPDKDADFSELHYVDAGLRWTGSATNSVSGLAHLNGKTVQAIAYLDGIGVSNMPAVVVSGGVATYPVEQQFTKIHIGLANEAIITPCRPELQANLTWQGKAKQVQAAKLRIRRSYGGKIAPGAEPAESDYQTIPYEGGPYQEFGAPPVPVTADLDLDINGNIDTDGVCTVKQDMPFPMTLLALITRIKAEEA